MVEDGLTQIQDQPLPDPGRHPAGQQAEPRLDQGDDRDQHRQLPDDREGLAVDQRVHHPTGQQRGGHGQEGADNAEHQKDGQLRRWGRAKVRIRRTVSRENGRRSCWAVITLYKEFQAANSMLMTSR